MKKRFIILLCTMLILAGCGNANATTSDSSAVQTKEETEKITYSSKIEKEECSLCSDHKKSLLSIYGKIRYNKLRKLKMAKKVDTACQSLVE